jgi:hypothetical protein
VTALDELVDSLLWEGYALYPYTPGATKNATPTPFGIVYPPAYASATTFYRLRIVVAHRGEGDISVEVRFLQASGERHQGVERRVVEPGPFAFDGLTGRVRLTVDDGVVTCCVHNTTEFTGSGRADALRSSLLSTHVVLRCSGGRFLSPLEHPAGDAINSYPVLASDDDRAVLGAAIVLPDHPRIAPESRGSLFDSTEIEEALLLHVLALSDGERDEIAGADPAVRAMIDRAVQATPEDIMKLHGRVTVRDKPGDEVRGEEAITVDGRTFARGGHVVLRPGAGHHAQDHLLDGRGATIERIYVDYDDQVHLCVTVDDDPGQDLMRDIGRYLYFKPAEVEVIGP